MKIKKMKINGYNVYIYNTNKYSSIHMRFLFEGPYTREGIFKYDLLEEYMIHSSKKYKTRKELSRKIMELYSLNYGLSNYNMGEKMFTEATFSFYDPELVGDDYLHKALEFAKEILMRPNFEDGKLDETELARSRDNLVMRIADGLMDFRSRADVSFIGTLFPNTYKMIDKMDSEEEARELIESYSDKDLIAAHRDLIDNHLVGLVIMGNIKDEYLDYIEELFKFKNVSELDEDYKEIIPIDANVKDFNHVSDEDYNESVVRAVYTYPAETLKEKFTYSAITHIIGGTGLLIHKTLRDEQGIVYSAGASYSRKLNYITMIAFIDAKNVDVALEGFDIVLGKLKDRELVERELEKVKEEAREDAYIFDESKWNIFFDVYDVSFNFDISNDEKIEIIESITVDDVMEALTKMKRKCVHFYEGARK